MAKSPSTKYYHHEWVLDPAFVKDLGVDVYDYYISGVAKCYVYRELGGKHGDRWNVRVGNKGNIITCHTLEAAQITAEWLL